MHCCTRSKVLEEMTHYRVSERPSTVSSLSRRCVALSFWGQERWVGFSPCRADLQPVLSLWLKGRVFDACLRGHSIRRTPLSPLFSGLSDFSSPRFSDFSHFVFMHYRLISFPFFSYVFRSFFCVLFSFMVMGPGSGL